MIPERFLRHLWRVPGLLEGELATTDGRQIIIRSRGSLNDDAGPDFLGCEFLLGGELVRGDVEVHTRSSTWLHHHHEHDPHYARVVLHAVADTDQDLPLPTLPLLLYSRYHGAELWERLMREEEKFSMGLVPCAEVNQAVPDEKKRTVLVRLARERLERKAAKFGFRLDELLKTTNDRERAWEQVLYESIFDALGYSVNRDAMVQLAKTVSLEWLAREQLHTEATMAVLLGCGGFLRSVTQEDDNQTAKFLTDAGQTWNTYRSQFAGRTLPPESWKRLRTRPQNFPERRIAAGAELAQKILSGNLLRNVAREFAGEPERTSAERHLRLCAMLEVKASGYFARRYDISSGDGATEDVFIGKGRLDTMIINCIVPLAWLHAKRFANDAMGETILDFSARLAPHESNKITRIIERDLFLDETFANALEEQGAIELYLSFCSKGKCLACEIGKELKLGES